MTRGRRSSETVLHIHCRTKASSSSQESYVGSVFDGAAVPSMWAETLFGFELESEDSGLSVPGMMTRTEKRNRLEKKSN
ncbi:hypothetical protein HanRHA438_Chr13g0585941 [Helianthus annuus]|nr:hypothetical protein HanRHA438_Chr13g0585941 [Helianthus annuus]